MKKRLWIILLVTAILSFGGAVFAMETTDVETETETKAETKEITVVSIVGNELTYTEGNTFQENPSKEGIKEKMNPPEAGTARKDMVDGDTAPESGQGKGSTGRGSMGRKTVYLPVAIPVHTGESMIRTFTILQAGDTLEVTILENEEGEEVITEIWLLKTGGSVANGKNNRNAWNS